MQRTQTTMVYLVGAEVIYQDQLNIEFDATPYGKRPFASGGATGRLSVTESAVGATRHRLDTGVSREDTHINARERTYLHPKPGFV